VKKELHPAGTLPRRTILPPLSPLPPSAGAAVVPPCWCCPFLLLSCAEERSWGDHASLLSRSIACGFLQSLIMVASTIFPATITAADSFESVDATPSTPAERHAIDLSEGAVRGAAATSEGRAKPHRGALS
jgi:hypothetical protein